MPTESVIESAIQTIRERSLPEGGFAMYRKESFRPDATAWAVMALGAFGGNLDLTTFACQRLARSQLPDGRISAIEGHTESYWPTSLALMAWKKIQRFERELRKAAEFLLSNTGRYLPEQDDGVFGHDTSIRGWPWIENTHSWIEPTSLTILALKVSDYGKHERVQEAVHMLLDRQLPSGGWNYGNTTVFGKELPPIPQSTGHALCALAGFTEPDSVKLSIDYLNREVRKIRTPLSLAWSIFGLKAWSNRHLKTPDWIMESLTLQRKYGAYNTALLSQLIVAYFTSGDFLSLFS